MEDILGLTGNSYIVVDLEKLRRNVKKIIAFLGDGITFLPVLKGNTCGHGLGEIADVLVHECGLEMLCVGQVIEAERLRTHGTTCDILVLGGTPFNNIPYVVDADITTTVSTAVYARLLSDEALRQNKRAKIHLKIDTGLGRMGVRPGATLDTFLREINRLPGLEIEGAYTHFSDSASLDTTSVAQQAANFDRALAQIKAAQVDLLYCHAANTPATVRFPQYHYNMVRSLFLLVGYDWSIDRHNRLDLEPILYWRGFIVQVHEFKAGERFDYRQALVAERDMRVAVTSFGYADGYPEDLAGRGGYVVIRGKKAPILSLHMDQGFVDVTDIDDVQLNDEVLILGVDADEAVDLDELLDATPHIASYVMSIIGQRVRRIYKGLPHS